MGKIKGHNFTGVYPSPFLIKVGGRKCIILSCIKLSNVKMGLFSCVFVMLTVVHTTDCQNAILNSVEEFEALVLYNTSKGIYNLFS